MNNNMIFEAGNPTDSLLPYETNPPRRILVVEDNRTIRQLNKRVLMDSGYAVDAAENGEVAWDTLQQNRYDLLITDNEMPKLSGVDLLKKLFVASMTLPVIMVSGTLPKDELTRQPWLEIEAMLAKPYAVEEFLATVRNVLLANDGVHDAVALPPIWQGHPQSLVAAQ